MKYTVYGTFHVWNIPIMGHRPYAIDMSCTRTPCTKYTIYATNHVWNIERERQRQRDIHKIWWGFVGSII